jgi:capsular polysaccharide biosynthesis protein
MAEDLDFRHFLGTLRRNVVFVIVTALLVAGAAFLTSKLQTPKYRATETLLFAPADSNVNPVDHAREISTLTALAKTDRVLGSAAQNLGIPTAELKNAISVSGTDTEDLIRINAVAKRGATAANYARAVGKSFIDWRKSIQNDQIRARITSLQDQLTQLSGRTSPSAIAAAGDLRTQLAEPRPSSRTRAATCRKSLPRRRPARLTPLIRCAILRSACSQVFCSARASPLCANGSTGVSARWSRSNRPTACRCSESSPSCALRHAGGVLQRLRTSTRRPLSPTRSGTSGRTCSS